MNRKEIKQSAKGKLNRHFSFFLQMFLLTLIFYLALVILDTVRTLSSNRPVSTLMMCSALIVFIGYQVFDLSSSLAAVDVMRNDTPLIQPFTKALVLFERGETFIGSLLVSLLAGIWICLWSLLLIVPGIVKAISYSQAVYIYRDSVKNNKPVKYREAITLSRQMMKGHCWEYFVFSLSFIGYQMLVSITVGLAGIWVFPYRTLAEANFYVRLCQIQEQDDAGKEIVQAG